MIYCRKGSKRFAFCLILFVSGVIFYVSQWKDVLFMTSSSKLTLTKQDELEAKSKDFSISTDAVYQSL